jgi:hypothetical protein
LDVLLKRNLEPLKSEMSEIRGKLAEVMKFIDMANEKYESVMQKFVIHEAQHKDLISENKVLKSSIREMEAKLINISDSCNDLEQYSRRDCLEIQGIPQSKDEDTNDIVKKVGDLMGIEVDEDDISISHRLSMSNKYKGKRFNLPIIVKFVRREMKEKFYRSRKSLKRFNTKDLELGYEETDNIYINESLTVRNKLLFKEALKVKKDLQYKFIWTSNGIIYLRKSTENNIIQIRNKDDIKKLSR